MKRNKGFFVYILRCRDGSFYTGYTANISERLKLHNSGRGAKYTKGRRPVKLAYLKEYRYYKNAIQEEIRIKLLSRERKLALIKLYKNKKHKAGKARLKSTSISKKGCIRI
ncbi:MAG: GIY-YIG nuclease family protein [Candidatus Omnitrophica bacterium]|nr:GIY-YIG nuclease family protein [Candidatus Omnitrophota bacterium]